MDVSFVPYFLSCIPIIVLMHDSQIVDRHLTQFEAYLFSHSYSFKQQRDVHVTHANEHVHSLSILLDRAARFLFGLQSKFRIVTEQKVTNLTRCLLWVLTE